MKEEQTKTTLKKNKDGYGQIYSSRYKELLQNLDPRNSLSTLYIDGGIDV